MSFSSTRRRPRCCGATLANHDAGTGGQLRSRCNAEVEGIEQCRCESQGMGLGPCRLRRVSSRLCRLYCGVLCSRFCRSSLAKISAPCTSHLLNAISRGLPHCCTGHMKFLGEESTPSTSHLLNAISPHQLPVKVGKGKRGKGLFRPAARVLGQVLRPYRRRLPCSGDPS